MAAPRFYGGGTSIFFEICTGVILILPRRAVVVPDNTRSLQQVFTNSAGTSNTRAMTKNIWIRHGFYHRILPTLLVFA